MNRGKLLAFEGLDGSGKSTQLGRAAQWLRAAGHDLVSTREYTDGPIGQRIGAMARSGQRVSAETELEWFVADRREHVEQVIEPALASGRHVLTDRYTLSSVAYQGARGLDPVAILKSSEAEFPLPDLALLFELPAADGMARVRRRRATAQPAFEQLEFLEEVGRIFAWLECPYIERIDARGDRDAVEAAMREAITRRLGL